MTEPIEEHPRGEPGPGAPREAAAPDGVPSARAVAWSAVKGITISVVVIFSLVVWGTCFSWIRATTPPKAWKKDAFVLTGEFRPDGSCAVFLDGELISDRDSARTEFDPESIHGAAPEEYDVPQVECDVDGGYFFVWGPVERGMPVPPGRYRITTDALPEGDTTAWEATLFHTRFDAERAYLSGYDGWVRFTRADDSAVTGSFRVVAKRTLRGPFE